MDALSRATLTKATANVKIWRIDKTYQWGQNHASITRRGALWSPDLGDDLPDMVYGGCTQP